jgi:LacI family transcriptional regulator
MEKINQQFIADHLQISRATVSRCFTNHPGINPETRAKVFDLAAQLGYIHMEMRAPTRARPKKRPLVGVLVCTSVKDYLEGKFESPGQKLFAGVSEFALLHNIKLDLHYVDTHADSLDHPDYRKIKNLQARKWAGVILIYPFPDRVIGALLPRFPLVSLVEQADLLELNCVDADHYKGIAMAVDRLVQAGHRRIGFFTRSYDVEAGWSLRRFSAFMEKMARLRLPVAPEDVINIHPNTFPEMEESFACVAQRVRAGVTAWVCAADHLAYDLIAAMESRGVSVPQRISVTGFDGISIPEDAPLLSTAVIPYREIGLIGGKRLLDLIEKRFTPVQHILVGTEFRSGATIQAPPKAAVRKNVHKIAVSS